MDYYLDTEFHEYHKQVKVAGIKVGKPIPTIDLISIGIVSETYQTFKDAPPSTKEYYAVCKDFNLEDAWNMLQDGKYWLRENVLKPIYQELIR